MLATLNYYLPVLQHSPTGLARKENDPYRGVQSNIAYLSLHGLKQRLAILQELPANWDGSGSAKPNPLAVANALNRLQEMYNQIIASRLEWWPPNITASEDGDIVCEWWRGDHKLTVYFDPEHAEFIKVWGSHIKNEMKDGQLEPTSISDLWKWLSA